MRGGRIPESDEVRRLLSKRHWRSYDHFILGSIWILLGVLIFLVLASRVEGYQDVLSNIKVESVAHNEVRIGWSTPIPATSQLEYGETDMYGFAASSTAYVKEHSLVLTSLEPNTEYHYRIIFHNSSRVSFSDDRTFKTSRAPQKESYILNRLKQEPQPIKVSEAWISPTWLLLTLIFILCVIYLFVFDKERGHRIEAPKEMHPKSIDEADEPLDEDHEDYTERNQTDYFIGSCIDKGMTLDAVKGLLEKDGWSKEDAYRRMAQFVLRKSYNNGYTKDETVRAMKAGGWDPKVVDACARSLA